jgi:hypothetical protein
MLKQQAVGRLACDENRLVFFFLYGNICLLARPACQVLTELVCDAVGRLRAGADGDRIMTGDRIGL